MNSFVSSLFVLSLIICLQAIKWQMKSFTQNESLEANHCKIEKANSEEIVTIYLQKLIQSILQQFTNGYMTKQGQVTLLCLLMLLLVTPTISARARDHSSTLSELFDDGSQMNRRIISEFLSSPSCQSMCGRWSENEVSKEFQIFRSKWVEKMVNFVIDELNVDPESARRVRQNPNNYMVNYETFKLLSFK